MKPDIHTSVDLLKAAAVALGENDTEELYHLLDILDSWMIDGEEARAYEAVLISMIEAIDRMA